MKTFFKNPLLYTNLLLIALVAVLAPQAAPSYAGAFDLVKKVLAAEPNVTGSGLINYLASFVGAASPSSQIGNSIIYDSGTNIGISTESPGAKLDINAGADNLLRLRQGANPATTFRVGTDGAMVIDNDGVSNVVTLNAGKVGIGTAAPATKLEISSGDLRLSSGYTLQWGSASNRIYNSSNAFYLDTNGVNRITVSSAGNVGIGNTAPTEVLHVGKSADATGSRIRASSDSGGISIFVQGSAEAGAHAGFGRASKLIGEQASYPMVISNNATQPIVFGTNDTERMRVTGTGNVGIGETNPQARLHVNGPIIIGPLGSYTPVNGMMWLEP